MLTSCVEISLFLCKDDQHLGFSNKDGPVLTLMDLFLWGEMKHLVCEQLVAAAAMAIFHTLGIF